MPGKPKMTDDERRAYSARMRGELESVMNRAYGAMVTDEQFWAAVMRTAATLADRGPVNCIAIAAQCPHATRVLSSGDWRKAGRFPAKGSTSIRIWTPLRRRTDDAQAATEAGPREAAAADAATEGEGRRVSGYKAGPVFDLSQTDGDTYEPPAVPRFTVGAIWAALANQPESDGDATCDYAVRLHLFDAASKHISRADAPLYGQREAEIASAAHVAALILGITPGPAAMPPLAGVITQDKKPPVHESAVRVIETGRAIAHTVAAAVARHRELTAAG